MRTALASISFFSPKSMRDHLLNTIENSKKSSTHGIRSSSFQQLTYLV